ncbi:uncharacterized protein TNCV_5072631 [Trichonephila clavipes]|nr:uncharacterized protein TNCV_5072631 [Trichonephila clavipes]
MAFLEKAKKQDLVLLAEELGQKVSDKMTIIDLKNIIIGSKDYEEEFVRAQLSVISEERVERETEEKIARQHAIQQLRWESELNELRLEIESIRSNVKRTSCAEDRKKTSSNYRISIGMAGEHIRETAPAVLMAEATIPVTTPIKDENGMDDLRVVYVKVKGEQEMVNAVMDTGAQMPVVRADVVEGQSVDSGGTIQIMLAFEERDLTELKIFNLKIDDSRHGFIHNPANSYVSSRAVEGITADDPKSISSQEMTRETYPSEIYIQSLSKANEEEEKFSDEDLEVTQAIEKVLVSKGEQIQTRSTDQYAVAQSVVVEKEKEEISVDVIKDKDESNPGKLAWKLSDFIKRDGTVKIRRSSRENRSTRKRVRLKLRPQDNIYRDGKVRVETRHLDFKIVDPAWMKQGVARKLRESEIEFQKRCFKRRAKPKVTIRGDKASLILGPRKEE